MVGGEQAGVLGDSVGGEIRDMLPPLFPLQQTCPGPQRRRQRWVLWSQLHTAELVTLWESPWPMFPWRLSCKPWSLQVVSVRIVTQVPLGSPPPLQRPMWSLRCGDISVSCAHSASGFLSQYGHLAFSTVAGFYRVTDLGMVTHTCNPGT